MSSLCAFGKPPVEFAVAIALYGPRCALNSVSSSTVHSSGLYAEVTTSPFA